MKFNNLMFITADIHYKEEKFNIIDNAFLEFIKKVKNNKPKFVIISGDYFNNRLDTDSYVYKTAINRLLELNSEILYKNIVNKNIEEQYIEIIEQLPRLTKKQKQ